MIVLFSFNHLTRFLIQSTYEFIGATKFANESWIDNFGKYLDTSNDSWAGSAKI